MVERSSRPGHTPPPDEDASMRKKAHKLCRDYLHGAWLTTTPDSIIFRKISGGLSNLLYYCELPESVEPVGEEPQRLLVRLYGRANEDAALLVSESVIFALLSESQRGPRLYGVFPGGRLEQYIPARPLLTKELVVPKLSKVVAEKMAQIHQMEVPINKRPKWLWQTMSKWLDSISEAITENDQCEEQKAFFERIKQLDLAIEFSWLKETLSNVESPVVFCHNDLQEGNILLLDGEEGSAPEMLIIDYEYCSYNYRGFDIANHLCEWTYDYSNEEPPYFWHYPNHADSEKQRSFVQWYLEALQKNPAFRPGTKDTIQDVMRETDVFILASHFFWGLWSIVNSTISKITFDYSGYGESRLGEYRKHKEKLLRDKVL